jgi:thiosulfate/3-mercaptopyruvate sulfurtransferase
MVGAMHPLISIDELATELAKVTVLDVRYKLGGPPGPSEFAAGHIPGAAYIDLDADLASPPGAGGRHPLPDAAAFEGAMRRAGVSNDRAVVVYDDWGGRAAARAWWLLRYFGHPNVRMLDGGWGAWTRAGGEVATSGASTGDVNGAPFTPLVGTFTATPGGMPIVEANEVPRVGVLIDARAPERFRGDVEPVDPVAGHIPGAVNVPTSANLDGEGRFRPSSELAAEYAQVGATPGADVAVYCGSGVTAAHDVLALEIAGVHAKLYPGSWSSWITDPSRPIVRGS